MGVTGSFAADDGSGMAHTAVGWGGGSSDKGEDGFAQVLGHQGCVLFQPSSDFANNDDGAGGGIFLESFQGLGGCGAG